MAEDIRISELSNVSSLGNNDLIEVSQVNAQSETGYDSKKATMINVGDRVCNGIEYANALYTSNKKIIGAINELTTYIPVWNNTASGAIATFDTSLALPLQDCTTEVGANKVVNVSGNVTDLATYIKDIYQGIYGFVDLGSLSWNYNPTNTYFYATVSDIKVIPNTDVLPNLMAYGYDTTTSASISGWGSKPNLSIGVRNNQSMVCVKNTAYTDTTAFTNAMSGVYLIYELETPTTPTITQAQLTAICASFGVLGTAYDLPLTDKPTTYVGTNNVFSDNGNTSVVYACSLKDYIDRQ